MEFGQAGVGLVFVLIQIIFVIVQLLLSLVFMGIFVAGKVFWATMIVDLVKREFSSLL